MGRDVTRGVVRGNGRARVPILLYHRVSDDPVPGLAHYCVAPHAFRQQMNWLKSRAYAVVSLNALVRHRLGAGPLPRRSIVITFDDGYEDNFVNAYPVLGSLGFPAIIFLVAGQVGQYASWDSSYGSPPRLLSWNQVHVMSSGPVSFGAHTLTHPHLLALDAGQAWEEIGRAKLLLEDKLGCEIGFFAYPYSDFSLFLRDQVARAGYRAGCSSIWGQSDMTDDIYALRRVIVGGGDNLESFARKVQGRSVFDGRKAIPLVFRRIKRAFRR